MEVPNWNEVYEDTKLPLMVDIGSGKGLNFFLLHDQIVYIIDAVIP